MTSYVLHTNESPSVFPTNITLDEVRESIKGRVDFREEQQFDYISFIYFLGMAPDIFPDPENAPDSRTKRLWQVRRECRGIIFNKHTGEILSRRFQKFFNIGELPETNMSIISIPKPFVLLEKLDGSMIAPFFVEGTLRYCTKSGYTDTSKDVERFVNTRTELFPYTAFCTEWIQKGYTPIFEWTSPSGRIVLEYKEESLHLLTLRHVFTGNYLSFDSVVEIAKESKIPYVKKWDLKEFDIQDEKEDCKTELKGADLEKVYANIKAKEGVEGFVLQTINGTMYKIKTNWYFNFHDATQILRFHGECHVWNAILTGTYDDTKALLPEPVREAIDNFVTELMKRATSKANEVLEQCKQAMIENPDRKSFNANFASKVTDPFKRSLAFAIREKILKEQEQTASSSSTAAHNQVDLPMVLQMVLESLKDSSKTSKTLKKIQPFLDDLTYEAYRPKRYEQSFSKDE